MPSPSHAVPLGVGVGQIPAFAVSTRRNSTADGSDGRFAVVPDSDGGRLDGTARTDRAVGPMQFLPGTWSVVGTDLTGDGTADPQNIFDAAASAGVYLCRSGPGLSDTGRLRGAILTYNRSQAYADVVLERAGGYAAQLPLG